MRSGCGTRQALFAGVALIALGAGMARAREANIAIPAQPLADTLKDIARLTGENILFTPESVSGIRAPALNGKLNTQDAVTRALAGSGLEAVSDGNGGLVIVRLSPERAAIAPRVQESERPSPPIVETIVVTGSQIPQAGVASASPIVIAGRAQITFSGVTDVTTVINSLPEAFADQNSGVSNGASGTANVDLRGLGSRRNLVLVNGTRLMPGDPQDPVPDLNDIPAALVDHAEVLTGGASVAYGSDALAGVVNFIMRKDFEGIELDGTYSVSENDNSAGRWRGLTQREIDSGAEGYAQSPRDIFNGQTEDVTFLVGVDTANDKGNITGYLGYRSSAPVLESTRDYSECAIQSTGPGSECSGSSNYNRWLSYDNLFCDIAAAYSECMPSGGSTPYDFFETGTGKPGSGRFTNYTGAASQQFNFGALTYLQRADTRYTGGFFAHYQESKKLDIYSSFMFADDYTVAQIAPSGLFEGSGKGLSGTVYVNCSNPLMTAQENQLLCGSNAQDSLVTLDGRSFWNGAGNIPFPIPGNPGAFFNPGAIPGQAQLLIGRRDLEGGNRDTDLRHTSYRLQIGARGDLGDGWSYNVYGQYGLTLSDARFLNEFSRTRVQNALQVDPATGNCYATESAGGLAPTDPNCIPLDIFDGFGSIRPSMLGYVTANGLQEGWTQESIVNGSITGDLGQWNGQLPWAKNPVGISFGSEYRQERLELTTDEEFQSFDLYGQGGAVQSVPASSFNVAEGFTEVKIPVVQDRPWFEDLTLNGGYRYSSYNIAGSTSTYKYGAEWQPIDDFRIRSTVQRAVRAPNVLELFSPANIALFPGQDPCATSTAGQCANVKNAGDSAILACPASQCSEQLAGNVHLKPETSDTRTAGIVFTPGFLEGFMSTVDWFDIRVSNFIATLPPKEILDECYGSAATPDSEEYFCPFVHRAANGTIFGQGYVASNAINTGYLKTRGVDFEISYQTDLAQWWEANAGTVSLDLIGTWLDELDTEAVPVGPLTSGIASQSNYNCAGLYGLICGVPAPKWRHKLRLTWSTPFEVQFSLQWRYIGAVGLDADTSSVLLGGGPGLVSCAGSHFNVSGIADCSDARISSYSYFDLSAAWDVRPGVEIRAGVNNIFDIEPPVIGSQALPLPVGNGNTFTGTYDTLGRTLFVAATLKF